MPVGKMIRLNSFITQQKPQSCDLWGFFIPFGQGGLFPQAGYQLLFSIQPFANVVGDYTCQNRKHKRRNYIHNNAPPFRTCIRGGSLAIVSCLGLFVYKKIGWNSLDNLILSKWKRLHKSSISLYEKTKKSNWIVQYDKKRVLKLDNNG